MLVFGHNVFIAFQACYVSVIALFFMFEGMADDVWERWVTDTFVFFSVTFKD